MLITQTELAKVIGISTRRIREIRQTLGFFETYGDTKKYNLATCVQEYIQYKIEAESGSGNANYDKEHAEHERAKKEITKLKLRKMRRELHEAADVEAVVDDMLICFRSKLLSVPSKLAPQLIGVKDVNEIMKMLKLEMSEVLEELSDYKIDDYTNEIEDEDYGEDETEDD